LHPHEEFVVCWDLVLAFDLIIEVYSSKAAVRMDLDLLALHKFAAKGLLAIVFKVENDFVPTLIKL
jgi:hypothetical protein